MNRTNYLKWAGILMVITWLGALAVRIAVMVNPAESATAVPIDALRVYATVDIVLSLILIVLGILVMRKLPRIAQLSVVAILAAKFVSEYIHLNTIVQYGDYSFLTVSFTPFILPLVCIVLLIMGRKETNTPAQTPMAQ